MIASSLTIKTGNEFLCKNKTVDVQSYHYIKNYLNNIEDNCIIKISEISVKRIPVNAA